MARRRRIYSIQRELLEKSREAALSSVKIFNDPLIHFKSESFVVLMIIAWTYLLHSYYRQQKVEYREFNMTPNGRRRFRRTKSGAIRHWGLEQCLNESTCPINKDARNNLRFLIGLRHEIEHQMTVGLDSWLSGHYQACAINYNKYVKQLFGSRYGLDERLMYSLQFIELSREQVEGIVYAEDVPPHLKAYITEFNKGLTEEEASSPQYAYRVHYTRVLVNRPGQAHRTIEFVDAESDAARGLEAQSMGVKDRERPKYRRKEILGLMRKEGFPGFKEHQHTLLWRKTDAKNPGKGFGVLLYGIWFWYDRWIDVVRAHCEENKHLYQ
ncbi:MAG: DUF3644 domain-containing protein [Chloroflexi bacterium]|nr:DUF3644 domain-containing protein [Chloroflexota bacterium]